MRKGTLKIFAGIGLLIVGGLVVPALVLTPIADAPDEEVRFVAPGEAELAVLEPGRFYLWHHYRTNLDGERIERHDALPAGTDIDVRLGDRALDAVPFDNLSTKFGRNASTTVARIDVLEPGTVTVAVTGGDGRPRVLSLQRARWGAWLKGGGLSLLSLLVGGGAGIVLIVFGVAQRARDE